MDVINIIYALTLIKKIQKTEKEKNEIEYFEMRHNPDEMRMD